MRAKVREKEIAITLRKKGLTYKDILSEVKVSKSTLSGWVKDLPLTYKEKIALRKTKKYNITRGRIKAAAAHTDARRIRENKILLEAQKEFKEFSKDELFKVGIGLYWAEGAKRNKYFSFSNSDVEMINLMIEWSIRFLGIEKSLIKAQLYIHKPYAHERCEEYWAQRMGILKEEFNKTIYKPTSRLVKKRPQYKGVLRISIYRREFLLKTKMWINMMVESGFKI